MTAWTPEELDKAKRWWAAGETAERIAVHFNLSRNAVIGRLHRAGVAKRGLMRPVRSPQAAPPHPTYDGRGFNLRMASRVAAATRPAPAPPPAAAPCGAEEVPFLDRTSAQCGWIVGDDPGPWALCCGAPKPAHPGIPYCPHHTRLAYAPRQTRRGALL